MYVKFVAQSVINVGTLVNEAPCPVILLCIFQLLLCGPSILLMVEKKRKREGTKHIKKSQLWLMSFHVGKLMTIV